MDFDQADKYVLFSCICQQLDYLYNTCFLDCYGLHLYFLTVLWHWQPLYIGWWSRKSRKNVISRIFHKQDCLGYGHSSGDNNNSDTVCLVSYQHVYLITCTIINYTNKSYWFWLNWLSENCYLVYNCQYRLSKLVKYNLRLAKRG